MYTIIVYSLDHENYTIKARENRSLQSIRMKKKIYYPQREIDN